MINYDKICILLRGVSGGSKTTFANMFSYIGADPVICCADYYFEKNGEYHFDPAKLGAAHEQCKDNFKKAVERSALLVIVANTNTRPFEFQYYEDLAKSHGYTFFSVILEKRFEGGNNGHNVPPEAVERQRKNLVENLKLV